MNKIFLVREYYDGGPNDQGYLAASISAENKEEAKKSYSKIRKNNYGAPFIYEVSKSEFNDMKKRAWRHYSIFKNIIK